MGERERLGSQRPGDVQGEGQHVVTVGVRALGQGQRAEPPASRVDDVDGVVEVPVVLLPGDLLLDRRADQVGEVDGLPR